MTAPELRVVLALGGLESEQHTPPDLDRVVEILQAWSDLRPVAVAEVVVLGALRQHQKVVFHRGGIAQQDAARGDVHTGDLGEQYARVRLAPKHAPDRDRDLGGRQARHGNLIEERLK